MSKIYTGHGNNKTKAIMSLVQALSFDNIYKYKCDINCPIHNTTHLAICLRTAEFTTVCVSFDYQNNIHRATVTVPHNIINHVTVPHNIINHVTVPHNIDQHNDTENNK
jgi:hypothetical protein